MTTEAMQATLNYEVGDKLHKSEAPLTGGFATAVLHATPFNTPLAYQAARATNDSPPRARLLEICHHRMYHADAHQGDNLETQATVFTINSFYPGNSLYETTPGLELGTGERFNLPRLETNYLTFSFPEAAAGDTIEISEVRGCRLLTPGDLFRN